MTREEAIEEIKNYEKYPNGLSKECRDYIVKALEQEPTTKNDLGVDCISRAEAIKCLECEFDITGKENMKTVVNYINSAHDKIVNLPRVKQGPKTGHWTEEFNDLEGEVRFTCSSCGKFQLFGTDFCYHCGSDNREVEA